MAENFAIETIRKYSYKFLRKKIKNKYLDGKEDGKDINYVLRNNVKNHNTIVKIICNFSATPSQTKENLINSLSPYTQKTEREELVEFIFPMYETINRQKGIAHSKAREYWMYRGPRLFCIMVLTVSITIALGEVLKEDPAKDRVYLFFTGFNLLVLSGYMLYNRLPDAISSCFNKIGHDMYKEWKNRSNFQKIKN
jgi:hypothetical protein